MSVPTFVVGTGRCGSTMLSNMLREHPKVLSLSEFFSMLDRNRAPGPFPARAIDGRELWELLAATHPLVDFALRQGITSSEILYPFDDPGARFNVQTGIPAILLITLPHLTQDHDVLFEVLREEVTMWPPALADQQYNRIFTWLTEYFGRRLWIERSGNALLLEKIVAHFSGARFIHIVRDGRDTAISLAESPIHRLAFKLGAMKDIVAASADTSSSAAWESVVWKKTRALVPESPAASTLSEYRLHLAFAARYWETQIKCILENLAGLSADRLLTLRYEDLLAHPKRQLDSLAAFLGDEFVDLAWSERCAATVRAPRSSWRDLPAAEAASLTEACRSGFAQLEAAGIHYEV